MRGAIRSLQHESFRNTGWTLIIGAICLLLSTIALSGNSESELPDTVFTGETLTLLYVRDVQKSVAFYKALGFEHDFYYDYREDIYSRDWALPYPPEYAEMIQSGIRIGLTTADEPEQVYGGGVRHYFIVDDVHNHFKIASKNGIVASPNAVEIRPWMSFFTVADPDNHQIVFGTKNQRYYDESRDQLNSLRSQ